MQILTSADDRRRTENISTFFSVNAYAVEFNKLKFRDDISNGK